MNVTVHSLIYFNVPYFGAKTCIDYSYLMLHRAETKDQCSGPQVQKIGGIKEEDRQDNRRNG